MSHDHICPGCQKPVATSGTFTIGFNDDLPVIVGDPWGKSDIKTTWHSGCYGKRAAPSRVSPDAEAMAKAVLSDFRQCKGFTSDKFKSSEEHLEYLVAVAITAATMREREACADLILKWHKEKTYLDGSLNEKAATAIAAAIRARQSSPPDIGSTPGETSTGGHR